MRNGEETMKEIKRLLVLLLLKLGSTSEEIGLALQVDSSVVRKMIFVRQVKKIVGEREK